MNNNVQVNLQFTANTAQAKQELTNLQTQLTSLINQPVPVGAKMTADIQKATAAAAELKVHLQNATNVKTGMLDFGKLNASIKQSGMSLSQYGAQLQALGPQGQQAFMQLANSVAAAEVPIRRASGALAGMMTTFKNTAKWMVSSTVLNGFVNTMSSAYNYAQDLNESLNNIRIVTGYNIDKMSKFAAEANKAAKALSTTTTAYTDASLIYYQQGLDDQQVKERTDVTIKMANVSRQSAEVVSDQMTAVWNNFYDGSKSLESYADALTALGAATASSTDEIAQGLEKFAAIADTVGLSYEYATAALATVTAQTRQSADVVGTAFKTLFARIQDLKLGETLEDGTTLGQYSEALNKVGVNIKGANGELKDMDIILNEIGAKWQTLERDEQTALAKAVGGLRQYNQFIALMDNWDFMQENLKVVENSTGTLQKQADIYAESWEAASKRVKASAEKVYSSLLNDKFFIELNNGLAGFLDGIGAVMKGMGGLKGVLSAIGVLVTKIFHEQIAQGFRNASHNLKMMTAAGREAVQQAKRIEMDKMKNQLQLYGGRSGMDNTMTTAYGDQIEAQSKIIANAEHMSEIEKTIAQTILDQGKALANNAIEYAKQEQSAKSRAAVLKGTALSMANENNINNVGGVSAQLNKTVGPAAQELGKIKAQLEALSQGAKMLPADLAKLQTAFQKLVQSDKELTQTFEINTAAMNEQGVSSEVLQEQYSELVTVLSSAQQKYVLSEEQLNKMTKSLGLTGKKAEEFKTKIKDFTQAQIEAGEATRKTKTELHNSKEAFNAAGEAAEKAKGKTKDWANNVTNVASTLMSVSMLLSSINGLIDTLQDPDTSGWEKFLAILSSVSMAAMSLVSVMSSMAALSFFTSKAKKKETQEINENSAANITNAATEDKVQKEKGQTATASGVKTGAMQKDTAATKTNSITNGTTGTYQGRKVVYSEKMRGWTWAESVKGEDGKVGRGKGKGGLATTNNSSVTQAPIPTTGSDPSITNSSGSTPKGKLLGGGSMAATLGLIVAGLAIAAASIYAVSEALNKHNKEAERAKEVVQELEKSYEETRAEYDNFINSTKSYKDLVVSMSSLTKGTLEYKEALLDANKEAMHLIETYEDLDYSINKDGLIQITNESFEKVQEQELQKLQKQQNAIFYGRIRAERAQANADSINFRRNYAEGESGLGGEGDGDQFLGSVGTGAGVGMAIGAIAGPLGALIGAGIGALVGAIGGLIWGATDNDATEAEVKALNSLEKAYIKNGDQALSAAAILQNVEIDDMALRVSLAENADKTAELIKSQIAAKDAIEANTRAILGETVGTEGAALLTKSVSEKEIEIGKEILAQFEKESIYIWSDLDSNSSLAYITNRYNEATGKNLNWLTDDTIQWKDGRSQLVYTVTENGQTVDKYLDFEAIYDEIVAAEVAKRVAEDEENKEILTAQEKIEDKYGENFYTNVVDAILTKKTTAESLFGENLTHQNLETLLSIGSKDELRKLLEESSGMSLEEFLSKSKYAGNENAFLDFVMQATQTGGAVFTDTLNSLAPELKEGFNNLISTGQLRLVGEKGKTDLVSAFNTLLVEESPEIANQFMNMLNSMAPEAVAAFTQTLSEKGLRSSAQDFNSTFTSIAKEMGVGEQAIASFIPIWEQFSKVINSTAKDIEERLITLRKLQSGETKTLADAIKDYLGLDIDEASLDNPEQREEYRQQLIDKGYTETENGLWVYNEESGKIERDTLVSDSATRAADAHNEFKRYKGTILTTNDEFNAPLDTLYSYGPTEADAYKNMDQLYQDAIDELLTDLNDGRENTSFSYTFEDGKIMFNGVDVSQRSLWSLDKRAETEHSLSAKTNLPAITDEQWARIAQLTVFPNERHWIGGATGQVWQRGFKQGITEDYNESFSINPELAAYWLKDIKTIVEAMGSMKSVEEIIGPNAFEQAGIPDLNALNLAMNNPDKYFEDETRAERFSDLWGKIREAIENGSFEKRLEERRESASEELIQNLYKNAQYSDLATLASSGQYQGQQIDLTDAQKEQAYWYGTKATTNIAELEGGGKYTDYLVETARVSDRFDDKLIETREAAEQLAASVLKVQIAFSELQDADYNQLFDTLYSGTYDWASPQYQQAEKEFDTLIRKLLNLEYENINTIMLFAQEANRDLLDSLMSGAIEYEEFTQGVAKNYALNMIKIPEETYASLETSFAKLGELAHGEEASKALIGTLNKTGLEAVDLDNILEILGYNVERSLDGAITRVTKLGNELINFDEILQNTQKDIDKLKDTDFFERYKEVNDALDNVANALERVNKQADRMYGKSRLQYMEAANKLLGNEIELLEYKRQEAQAYLIQDQENLNQIAKENIGTTFDFDNTTGDIPNYTSDITNYDEIMSSVRKNYESYYNKAKKGGFTEGEQNRLEDYNKATSAVQEAISTYDETKELLEDIENEIRETVYSIQDNNYKQFTYEIEIDAEIRSIKLDWNQYNLDKVMTDLLDAKASGNFDKLMTERFDNIETAFTKVSNNITELEEMHNRGMAINELVMQDQIELNNLTAEEMGISRADFIKGLQEERQNLYDNINTLQELDATMQSYYGDTLAAANEELEKHISLMTNATGVLEHYQNLMKLTGKGTDYKAIGRVLEGQANIAIQTLAASTAIYEERSKDAELALQNYQNALVNGTGKKSIETLKNIWMTAQSEANDAQNKMLEDTQKWAEAQNAILENSLADLGKTLEQAITGGSSYEDLTTALDRAAVSQEEYLTTTNKIYETNKLINKAQQEIDKTTNTVAKRRLQNFAKETEQLQQQARLSNFELEIQQAKYNLLLAEIALEEAQNAKSVVRLQRNAEGNFGYVYTADQNVIDDAQQQVEDAENDLYNIRLKGANDYAQKSIELQTRFADEMMELNKRRQEGEFESEQAYNEAVLALEQHYYEQLKTYANLYGVAISEDSCVFADAWSSSFSEMATDTEDWYNKVKEYINGVQEAFSAWDENLKPLYEENGTLFNIEISMKNIVDSTKTLRDLLMGSEDTNGIIKDSSEAVLNALNLVTEYGKIRDIYVGDNGLLDKYEEELKNVDALIIKWSNFKDVGIDINHVVDQEIKVDLNTDKFNIAVKEFERANKDLQSFLNALTTSRNIQIGTSVKRAGMQANDSTVGTITEYDDFHQLYTIKFNDGTIALMNRQDFELFETLTKRVPNPHNSNQLIQPYDTGGYTGEWGPEGKLALLHEKELILNSDDTSNFLSALGLLDNILLTLDKYSVNAQLGGLLNSPGFLMNNSEALEQNVHIEASFPGVTDRNEIEEAFNNLVNRASQYANRK